MFLQLEDRDVLICPHMFLYTEEEWLISLGARSPKQGKLGISVKLVIYIQGT